MTDHVHRAQLGVGSTVIHSCCEYGLVAVEEEVGGRRETKEPNDPSSPLPLSLPNCWLSVRLIKP